VQAEENTSSSRRKPGSTIAAMPLWPTGERANGARATAWVRVDSGFRRNDGVLSPAGLVMREPRTNRRFPRTAVRLRGDDEVVIETDRLPANVQQLSPASTAPARE
jgi:hypothetical protein